MLLLVLGLLLWIGAHLLRSCAKGFRESMQQKFGSGSKGIIALVIIVSLVMMIFGYQQADKTLLWAFPAWAIHVNNLLMFVALYIFFTTTTKTGTAYVMGSVKNPQLTGFKIWAVAHLLVNGDVASLILFGGLLIWAVLEVIFTKKSTSLVDRSSAPISSPLVHLALVIVVYLGIMLVHNWLGVRPFA